jgi:hypothetical protein
MERLLQMDLKVEREALSGLMIVLLINGPSTLALGQTIESELLGVWVTLFLAIRLHITDLQIIGDSKIIIDWCNGNGRLQILALEGWKDQIKN